MDGLDGGADAPVGTAAAADASPGSPAGAAPASSSAGGHLHEADEAQSIEGSKQQIVQQIVEVSEQLRSLAMKHPLEVKQAALKQRMGTSIQPLVDALGKKWNYLWSTGL